LWIARKCADELTRKPLVVASLGGATWGELGSLVVRRQAGAPPSPWRARVLKARSSPVS